MGGTAAYRGLADVPARVRAAVEQADTIGFELCVRPETGRLLGLLAAGLPPGSVIAEAGTGTGAGLAWMVSHAPPDCRFLSFELDADRAAVAQRVFEDHAGVEIVAGDAAELVGRGPFDLLVLDGGPLAGKQPGTVPVEPARVLTPAGTLTIDDYTPTATWPPMFDGEPDRSRIHWLTHPDLRSTEIRVAPDLAVVVGRRR